MNSILTTDEQWRATVSAVSALTLASDGTILAPEEFLESFPRVIGYQLVNCFRADFYDIVVVHKGLCKELGGVLLEYWEQHYGAVFANAVFVVFVRDMDDQVDRESDDLRSLSNRTLSLQDKPIPRTLVDEPIVVEGDEKLDFRGVNKVIHALYQADKHILAGPQQLRCIFAQLLDFDEVLKTSMGACDLALITINTAGAYPYKDLLLLVGDGYEVVYSDLFMVLFVRKSLGAQQANDAGFANVIREAMHDEDYLFILKDYRETLTATRE